MYDLLSMQAHIHDFVCTPIIPILAAGMRHSACANIYLKKKHTHIAIHAPQCTQPTANAHLLAITVSRIFVHSLLHKDIFFIYMYCILRPFGAPSSPLQCGCQKCRQTMYFHPFDVGRKKRSIAELRFAFGAFLRVFVYALDLLSKRAQLFIFLKL